MYTKQDTTIGMFLVKQASQKIYMSKFDDPMVRTLIGAGLGGLIGTMYTKDDKHGQYASEKERKEKMFISGLRGALLGGGVGFGTSVLGLNVGEVRK